MSVNAKTMEIEGHNDEFLEASDFLPTENVVRKDQNFLGFWLKLIPSPVLC